MVKAPALFILGSSALPLALKLKAALGGQIHGPRCVEGLDHSYEKSTAELQRLFRDGEPIIAICAAGIVIRALAGILDDKRREPPVIALAGDGSSIVPLLGGHHGGNELARQVAQITGGHAAITTADGVLSRGTSPLSSLAVKTRKGRSR